jgi:hypothetical protein
MAKKQKKAKKKDDLDMETTVANMNVEGFSWYDPTIKDGPKNPVPKLTKKEQRAMIKGAFRAMLPMIVCIGVGCLMMFLLAYLWLS